MPENKLYRVETEYGFIYIEAEKNEMEIEGAEDDGSSIPVNTRSLEAAQEKGEKFETALGVLLNVSKTFVKTAQEVNSKEFEIEMGLKFNGEMGVPYLAKSSAEAHFKVRMLWKNEKTISEQDSSTGNPTVIS